MRFPKPEGGGIVIVSYPFVFKGALIGLVGTFLGIVGGLSGALLLARNQGAGSFDIFLVFLLQDINVYPLHHRE